MTSDSVFSLITKLMRVKLTNANSAVDMFDPIFKHCRSLGKQKLVRFSWKILFPIYPLRVFSEQIALKFTIQRASIWICLNKNWHLCTNRSKYFPSNATFFFPLSPSLRRRKKLEDSVLVSSLPIYPYFKFHPSASSQFFCAINSPR